MNKFWNNFLSFVLVIVVSVITIFLLSKITSNQKPISKNDLVQEVKDEVIKEQIKPSSFPDYDLLSSFKKIEVTSDTTSFVNNKGDIIGRTKRTLYPTGNFQRMYVYIEASVDNGKPLSVYDDVFLTFNFQGGHILPTDSLPTPPNSRSILLYSAENLPYKSGKQKYELDVLKLFNQNSDVGVNIFLSTARKGGEIHSFSLYYECAEGSSCSIQ